MRKIIEYKDLQASLNRIKSQGTIVLVGGCFDVLHKGHIKFLTKAQEHGDILMVMLESDENVRASKGPGRPVNNQIHRAHILAALKQVDYVLLLPSLKTDLEYYELVKKLEPDIIAVTENDPAYKKKAEQAEMVGGKVVEVIERLPHSTTKILEQVN
ncbi:MAG: adenylyltransferase/cytidyltransferase family protein [Candidatus Levyibacteriota bacterium]